MLLNTTLIAILNRLVKKSNIAITITEAVASKRLPQPFTVADVNRNCNGLLDRSPAFLSKHAKGNPGNHTPYFVRVARGKYKIIEQ
jgi:hypothetical protein